MVWVCLKNPMKKMPQTLSWEEFITRLKEKWPREKAFHEWVASKEHLGGRVWFNDLHWRKLYNIQRKVIKKDKDHFIVITGNEGCGKSTIALQCALVLYDDFRLKNICVDFEHTVRQFKELAENSKYKGIKGQTLLLDEGNMFLFARDALSANNKTVTRYFTIMRQFNTIVIICVPKYSTIDAYIREHRVDTIIRVINPGKFVCCNKRAAEIIAEQLPNKKRLSAIKIPEGTFYHGYFLKEVPEHNDVSWDSYVDLKNKHGLDYISEIEASVDNKDTNSDYMNLQQAAEYLCCNKRYLADAIRNKEINARFFANKWLLLKSDVKAMFQSVQTVNNFGDQKSSKPDGE